MRRNLKKKITTKLQWELGATTTAVTSGVTRIYEEVGLEFTNDEEHRNLRSEWNGIQQQNGLLHQFYANTGTGSTCSMVHGDVPVGQGWMNDRRREQQRVDDGRHTLHAQETADRLALHGPPAAVARGGWGGCMHTEGEPEVAEPSGEGTSGESAQAGSDDSLASTKAQKLATHKGARCVCFLTRDGICRLQSGISTDHVIDCWPLGFSVQNTQDLVIDEASLHLMVQQFYVRLEWEAHGQILECDVPSDALRMAARYRRCTEDADAAEMFNVPAPTGWCVCKKGLAGFFPYKHLLPLCCGATAVPDQGWLAAMAMETKLYYSSCVASRRAWVARAGGTA